MRYENPEELASEMGTGVDFVSATIGLDDGVLSKNETKLCFFSQRMGGWEVIEEISISEINRIEVSESLLGSTTTVVTKSGRWICRDVADGVDVAAWLGQSGPSNSVRDKAIRSMKAKLESQKKNEPQKIDDMTSGEHLRGVAGGRDSKVQNPKPMDISSPQPLATNKGFSPNRPISSETQQELTQILNQMELDPEESGSPGCGKSLLRFIIFIWVIGFVTDMCN